MSDTKTLTILSVSRKSEASKRGFQVGDILIKYNDVEIDGDKSKFLHLAAQSKANSTIEVLRNNHIYKIIVFPGEIGISGAEFTTSSNTDLQDSTEESASDKRINSIILTTETYPKGMNINERIEIITAECAFGINIFRDMFAVIRDYVGGRSESTQKALRDARRQCLSELKIEAVSVGANAVVGVRLDYNEISGGNKSILFIVASGTAVTLNQH
jgi:uncharacterized protein YbjQ (UPF0145 family)